MYTYMHIYLQKTSYWSIKFTPILLFPLRGVIVNVFSYSENFISEKLLVFFYTKKKNAIIVYSNKYYQWCTFLWFFFPRKSTFYTAPHTMRNECWIDTRNSANFSWMSNHFKERKVPRYSIYPSKCVLGTWGMLLSKDLSSGAFKVKFIWEGFRILQKSFSLFSFQFHFLF